MRAGLILFWITMAVLEVARRWNPGAVTWLGQAGPWLVLAFTLLPVIAALREARDRRLVGAIKSALWSIPGVVTLVFGPAWLRW